MDEVDVLAVIGTCAPERARYAARLAAASGRVLFPARRLGMAPDPVDEAVGLVPWTDRAAGAVCEFPTMTMPTRLIGALADEGSRISLTGIVCVADAAHLLDDLQRDHYLARTRLGPLGASTEYLAHAVLTMMHLEYASMIVLVNWEPLPTPELSTVLALVSHLSPRARLRLDHGALELPERGEPYEVGQERPGWVAILNREHEPHMTDTRVAAFRYEQLRPFHPLRLHRLLDDRIEQGEFGTVIRSAGMCRLATRPDIIAEWEHVGHMFSLDPLALGAPEATEHLDGTDCPHDADDPDGEHEILALGQDLAFIGLDLDTAALTEALDAAALTDDELSAGPAEWQRYPDPFPAWIGIPEHSD